MFSEKINKLFPHDVVRPEQDKLIGDLFGAFSQQKILLAHAPTGLGKTASALTAAISEALEKKKKVFFLTNRNTQHAIAIETIKAMRIKNGLDFSCVDLIGKRWMCSQEIGGLFGSDFMEFCRVVVERGECEFYNSVWNKRELQVEAKALVKELQKHVKHNGELIAASKERRMCGYEIALTLAKEATVIIGDYNYLFNHFIQLALFSKLNLALGDCIVIIDEAHNLPTRIREMHSLQLTSIMMRNAILEARKFQYNGLVQWVEGLSGILGQLAIFPEGKEQERLVAKEEFTEKMGKIVDYQQFIDELTVAADEVRKRQRKSSLGGIAAFLEAWNSEEKGFSRYISLRRNEFGNLVELHYACLDPAVITKPVFQQIYAGALMSGTLKPLSMYKDILGIERGVEREYSSPFPLENKITIILPETTTKYTSRNDAMYVRIAEKCSELVSLITGNVAFFFPSYNLRDRVSSFLTTSKKKFLEKSDMTKEEKDLFLQEFKAEKNLGGVLLGVTGANFAEGVDFPGDLLNGVVVVGLPLAKPDLRTREIIKYYEEEFGQGWNYGYIFPAMNKCFQSAGRCIRSEQDRGAVVFLDERFAWPSYYDCFPREGVMVTKEYKTVLQQFFDKSV